MDNWHPIETAPRDGAELLLLLRTANGHVRRVGWWEDDDCVHLDDEDAPRQESGESGWTDGFSAVYPEAWAALPDVPRDADFTAAK